MTTQMTTAEMTQTVKSFLLSKAFNSGRYNSFSNESDEAETVVELVATGNYGFASEIATTVNKFKRVSEKQAYWIAKAAVENNLCTRIDYLFA